MDDYEKYNLKNDASNILCKRFEAFIDDYNNDKYLYELIEYINDAKRNNFSWSIEKIQIVLSVLQLKNHNDIQEILSYLEQSNYGWQNDKYHFYNRCLNFDQRCRRRYTITEPLPAKAGRFGVLLKQPKACTLKVILFPLLLNLSQSYQSYSSPVDLDSEYTL